MIKVMKYQIIKPMDIDWDTFGDILHELQRETRTALNKTIQLTWEYSGFSAEYNKIHGVYPTSKKVLDYSSLHGYAYDRLKSECRKLNTANLSQSIKRASDKWKVDLKELLRGNKSIPSFRKDMPIDVVSIALKINKQYNENILEIRLLSKEYRQQLERKKCSFNVLIHSGEKSKQNILDRLRIGEYKLGVSQILYHKKKWFINITYQFESEVKPLDPNSIMGIDLGISNAVYMAFNQGLYRYKIAGGEIEQFRKQIERRRRDLLVQSKYAGEGRSGHGTKTKIAPIEVLSERAKNFKDTINHKYARYVVDMAVKHHCGTIQMEDLTGIREQNTFLANWPYFDLQEKITYKALEVGINVIKINPEYTSQRCNLCGHIEKENRLNQADFKCLACGLKTNADFNAARNIATLDIENIIIMSKTKH